MARPTLLRFSLLAGLLALTGASAYLAYSHVVPEQRLLTGIRVDGERIPSGTELRWFIDARGAKLGARKVKVVLRGEGSDGVTDRVVRELSLAELGVTVDAERTAERVLALGDGSVFSRVELAERARKGEVDVPLVVHVDPTKVPALFADLKEEEDYPPVPARMDLDKHTIVAEKDGHYVDYDGLVADVERAALYGAVDTVSIPFAVFPPRVTSESLRKIDISEVLASFETKFSRQGGQAHRARNIEVAASRVNGLVIPPGSSISFNEVVGARSTENGFQKAGEIFKGELIEGVGGGTCQVASTLYASAMYAGLDIIERLPHSRPSAYIALGLDATVVYPSVDLKLRNPFTFPVVVHAVVDSNKLRMELLGQSKLVDVTVGQTVVGSFPFTRKIVEENWVTKPFTKQKGIRGYQVRRSRTIAFHGGEKRVETSLDFYPPTIEIYKVPPGFDAAELPPLPEEPGRKQDG